MVVILITEVTQLEEYNSSILEEILNVDWDAFSEKSQTIYSIETFARFGKIFLLHSNNELIGVSIFIKDWINNNKVYLSEMSINKKNQNVGFGTKFMREIINFLKQEGIDTIVLHVDPLNNIAVHLYKDKFGFTEIEFRKDEYGIGEDRLYLELKIN